MVNMTNAFEEAKTAVANEEPDSLRKVTEDVMLSSHSYSQSLEGNGRFLDTKSAINRKPIADVRETTKTEYQDIFSKSKQVQELWAKIPVAARANFLSIFSEKLAARQDQIAFAITANVGKGVADSKVEYAKADEWTKWALRGDTQKQLAVEFDKTADGEVAKVKRPAGVVGVVTSFNYPLALSIAGIVSALMSGNSVVFKNASIAPYWSYFFKDAFSEAMTEFLAKEDDVAIVTPGHWMNIHGVNEEKENLLINNLFSIINGRDNSLVTDVDNLFFVGGTSTGNSFAEQREAEAERTGRILTTHLELGGNSAAIVLQSAFEGYEDIDVRATEIAKTIFDGAIGNSGQRCTAARLLVRDGSEEAELVFQKLQAMFIESVDVGNPFDAKNRYGALVDNSVFHKLKEFEALYETLRKDGVNIKKFGGGVITNNYAPHGGNYVRPAMYDWTNVSDEVLNSVVDLGEGKKSIRDYLSHETFGPLMHVVRKVNNREDALAVVHEYDQEKLAAGIFTNKEDFDYFDENLEVTSKKHNSAPKDQSPAKPHGNWANRFHTGGEHAFDSYTRVEEIPVENPRHKIVLEREHGAGLALAS